VGVTQPGFFGVEVGRAFSIAAPLCSEPVMTGEYSMLASRTGWWLSVMGRLKPGWTMEQANAQLRAVSSQIFEAAAPTAIDAGQIKKFLAFRLNGVPARGGISALREESETSLWLLLALAGAVLLIASANLANLMLARASAREREMGLRLALGAGRSRLIRQLLAESLLLAAVGAAVGVAIARVLSRLLIASMNTQRESLFLDFTMDWRIFVFTMGLAVLACALFGLVPALRATRVSPGVTLKEAAWGMTEGRTGFGFRRALVVAQMALSLVLVVGALLFMRSLQNITSVDAGFRQDGIVFSDIDFSELKLAGGRRTAFANELLQRIRAIPGVDAAAMVTIVPLSGNGIVHDIRLNEGGAKTGDDESTANCNDVSPGFFDTTHTHLLEGRDFTDRDVAGAPLAAIVNESFVRKFINGGNALSTTFRVAKLGKVLDFYQIVGVAQDAKYYDLREAPQPTVYTAITQNDHPDTDAQFLVRSKLPTGSVISSIKGAASEMHPGLVIAFLTFHKMIEDGLVRERLMARLSGFFGLLAVLLAIIGLYGVISYMVVRRRNEIGIRMALGANRTRVIRLVMREALLLVGLGLPIGVGLALAAGKGAASMQYGLRPWDALTIGVAASTLALIAVFASFFPALRAARLEPMAALRDE
jgi:predicted permease